jgi:hypothetical protein
MYISFISLSELVLNSTLVSLGYVLRPSLVVEQILSCGMRNHTYQFFVTPGVEMVLFGFCTLTVKFNSMQGNLMDLSLENLVPSLWT